MNSDNYEIRSNVGQAVRISCVKQDYTTLFVPSSEQLLYARFSHKYVIRNLHGRIGSHSTNFVLILRETR